MADYKISDLDAYPNNELQDTDLLEVSWDDSGTFKSRKVTGATIKASKPYLVYSANLTQTSTNAPTAEVLENTLSGTPTFTYVSTGVYKIVLTGEWVNNLTFILVNTWHKNGFVQAYRLDANEISLRTFNTSLVATDAILEDSSIEIRVYPSLIS
jgi:hypothetical protein